MKKRIAFLSLFIAIIFTTTAIWSFNFYLDKRKISSIEMTNSALLAEKIDDYRSKDSLVIASDYSYQMFDVIYLNEFKDKFISMSYFYLTENEFKQLLSKEYIDMWVINKRQYISNLDHIDYLKNSEVFKIIDNDPDKDLMIFVRENDFLKNKSYEFRPAEFKDEWIPLNDCKFLIENNIVLIEASGDDPYFENLKSFTFEEGCRYFCRIEIVSNNDTYLQVFYKSPSGVYSESNSTKYEISKGDNVIIAKIPNGSSNIRIDPGTFSGEYVLSDLSIYFR